MPFRVLPAVQDRRDDDLLTSHPIDDRGAAIIGNRAEIPSELGARRAAMGHIRDTTAAIEHTIREVIRRVRISDPRDVSIDGAQLKQGPPRQDYLMRQSNPPGALSSIGCQPDLDLIDR